MHGHTKLDAFCQLFGPFAPTLSLSLLATSVALYSTTPCDMCVGLLLLGLSLSLSTTERVTEYVEHTVRDTDWVLRADQCVDSAERV